MACTYWLKKYMPFFVTWCDLFNLSNWRWRNGNWRVAATCGLQGHRALLYKTKRLLLSFAVKNMLRSGRWQLEDDIRYWLLPFDISSCDETIIRYSSVGDRIFEYSLRCSKYQDYQVNADVEKGWKRSLQRSHWNCCRQTGPKCGVQSRLVQDEKSKSFEAQTWSTWWELKQKDLYLSWSFAHSIWPKTGPNYIKKGTRWYKICGWWLISCSWPLVMASSNRAKGHVGNSMSCWKQTATWHRIHSFHLISNLQLTCYVL